MDSLNHDNQELHLSNANTFVSSKSYDKYDDFDFDIVNLSYLDFDVPRRASYGVYISQLIRIARVYLSISISPVQHMIYCHTHSRTF